MRKRHTFRLLILILLIVVIVPSVTLAAGLTTVVPCGGTGQAPCKVCDLAQLAQNILNDAIYMAVFLSAILFAWAGFKYLTAIAGGDISQAKSMFTNVFIGLVIILASWLVVDVVMRTLVGASVLPWNTIC